MKIQCIALDLDRTTLNQYGKLSDGNRQALMAAIEKKICVVIASGRGFDSLPEDVLSVPGIEYAITSNGAAIYHIPTGKCLHQYKLIPDSINLLLQTVKEYPVALEIFMDGIAYGEADYVNNPVSYGTTAAAVPYIQTTRRPVTHMHDFISRHQTNIDSLDIVVSSPQLKKELWTKLSKISDFYITSSVPQLIEISHKNAGKHSGLRFLMDFLHLRLEQTAAFGDGDNDVDLLQAAGIGIAMENASPKCKAAADAVTRHHNEDGVAWGMKHILHIL